MKKVDLNQVLELLINEEREAASALLHDWFVGMSKNIHESLMQEEDEILENDRLTDIENDKDAIEAEEFYGDGDLSEAEDEEAGEEDAGNDEDTGNDEGENIGDADASEDTDGVDIEDKVEDLEAKLAELKAEFEKLMGGEELESEIEAEAEDETAEGEDEFSDDSNEDSIDDEDFDDEDFEDLDESFKLEPVKDPALNGGKEIGSDGAKIAVNDKSPIPQKKLNDRVGGKAVSVKSDEHKGYDLENAPEVKTRPLAKNQVKKATDGRSSVSQEGDKSALLNKKEGR